MKITTILFDLDGTLLPMDQDLFIKRYMGLLARAVAPLGYAPEQLYQALIEGIAAMAQNDGNCLNEDAFWRVFCTHFGEGAIEHKPHFDAFYRGAFQQVKDSCGVNPKSAQLVLALKERGYRVVLATNPFFPAVATHSRIRWGGMEPEWFDLCTTYENSRFCKPNPAYYGEILQKLNLQPEECVMIGNDAQEDMIAGTLGMRVFLLTDCLITHGISDLSAYPQGGFDELHAYLGELGVL